jgi:hypothetical protein
MIDRPNAVNAIDLAKSSHAGVSPDSQPDCVQRAFQPNGNDGASTGNGSSTPGSIELFNAPYESMAAYAAETAATHAPNDMYDVRTFDQPAEGTENDTSVIHIPKDIPSSAPMTTADLTLAPAMPGPAGDMELDEGFFQFFQDMNAMSEGGLTGLDNWTDFTPCPSSFNWPNVGQTYPTNGI